jgi:hypothetical protein
LAGEPFTIYDEKYTMTEEDFYILPDGRYVFTASFLRKRGYCCGSGCTNCPYDYSNVPEPKKSHLIQEREKKQNDIRDKPGLADNSGNF